MQTVLFFPGFQENEETRDYSKTIKAIELGGYKVIFVDINWVRTTMEDWLATAKKEYSKYNSQEVVLAGFSFGAMIAFCLAVDTNPSELWLFSLSPYFYEDIHSKHMKKSWLSAIGHRRVLAFDKLYFSKMSKEIMCKTKVFAGSKELEKWPGFNHRFLEAGKMVANSESFVIEGVEHDVADDKYVQIIRDNI